MSKIFYLPCNWRPPMKPVAETAIPSEELELTANAPCESTWIKEIEKLREEIQDLTAQRQNLRTHRITCWGCGGEGHLRSSCPQINKEDRNIKVLGVRNRKRSAKGNEDVPLRRTCLENRKYCSRIEKKSGVIDQVVRQVTTPSTAGIGPVE
ncbi:CCHC-type domain-containing protein [Trichonephila clavipes]|nr:CCHC-type domain-containing protein [Trichonephila clavipes]